MRRAADPPERSKSGALALALAALGIVGCNVRADVADASTPQTAPLLREPADPVFARSAILIVVDGLRADTVGPDDTPALVRLAGEGVSVPCISAGGSCVTSIAGLLTGVSPETLGVFGSDDALPIGAWTLADATHCAGLQTAMFAANGYLRDRFGFGSGWNEQANYVYADLSREPSDVANDAWLWIDAHRSDRFFVYVHLMDNDTRRWEPPESPTVEDVSAFRALYEDDVRSSDDAIAWLLQRVRAAGLDETTLLVVTSDRGEALGEDGAFAHHEDATPALRRVPLIFWGAAVPAPSRALATGLVLASGLDVAPTILDALGLDLPRDMEGESFGPRGLHRAQSASIDYYPRTYVIEREICEQLCALSYLGCLPRRCRGYPSREEIAQSQHERALDIGRSCEAEAAYEREHPAERW